MASLRAYPCPPNVTGPKSTTASASWMASRISVSVSRARHWPGVFTQQSNSP